MEHVNMTWVNKLRLQYLRTLEFYEETSQSLPTSEVKAYKMLLSVKTVDEFKQWRRMMDEFGMSYVHTDYPKSLNLLSELDDCVEGANDTTIAAFIKWKLTINPSEHIKVMALNSDLVHILRLAVKRDEDVHIYIFPCGKRWAVIGQDADRLFELFGWQTGYVIDNDGTAVSWMFINPYGLEVLKHSGYSIKFMDYGEFDIISEAFEEDITASLQQFVDYLRMMTNLTTEMQDFMKKLHPISVPVNGYHELMEGKLKMLKDGVSVIMPDGKMIPLAEGHSWRLDALGRSCLNLFTPKIGEA